jgi:hypothetical protein
MCVNRDNTKPSVLLQAAQCAACCALLPLLLLLLFCKFFVSVITVPFHTKKRFSNPTHSERKSVSPHLRFVFTQWLVGCAGRGLQWLLSCCLASVASCRCKLQVLLGRRASDTHTRLLPCFVLSRRADNCWSCRSDASAACVLACSLLSDLVPKLEPSQFDNSLVLRLRLQAAVLNLLSQTDADLTAHCCGMLLCASQLVLL